MKLLQWRLDFIHSWGYYTHPWAHTSGDGNTSEFMWTWNLGEVHPLMNLGQPLWGSVAHESYPSFPHGKSPTWILVAGTEGGSQATAWREVAEMVWFAQASWWPPHWAPHALKGPSSINIKWIRYTTAFTLIHFCLSIVLENQSAPSIIWFEICSWIVRNTTISSHIQKLFSASKLMYLDWASRW